MVPTPVILANCTAEREVISRHKLIVCLSHVAGDGNELHSSQTDAFFRLPTSNTPAERRARTHEHFRIFTLSGRSVALLREGRRDAGRRDHFELSRVRYPVPLHLRNRPRRRRCRIVCRSRLRQMEGRRGSAESHNGVELRNLNGEAYPSRL